MRILPTMKKNNWIVITGGPCSGKTTVLTQLEKNGYTVIPEAARNYIERALKNGKTLTEIRADEIAFQNAVLELKHETEEHLAHEKLIFFDRAIPDTLAYYQWQGKSITLQLEKLVRQSQYRKVFLFELLDYEIDDVRVESRVEAKRLECLLKTVYQQMELPIVFVPKMSVEKRITLIKKHLDL